MHVSRLRAAVALAGTVGLLGASVVGAQLAQAATGQICTQYGSTTQGNYIVMNNRWGTSATQCINVTTNGFQIVQQDGTGNLSGAPVSYPAIYAGCHYSNCSPNTNMPALISSISSANTSVSVSYPSSGTYDAAYDIWINDTTNVTGVQKTEVMIWLNHTGSIQPIGSSTGTFSSAGKSWTVWTGNNGSNNVVSYQANPAGVTSLSFDAMAFVRDAMTRGSGFGTNSWYLTSIQMGFEPWVGGVGLAVNSFSASVATNGGPTPTPVRTASPTPAGTGTGAAKCSASLHVDNQWSNGFTATVTISNTGTVATKTWKATWTWGGNQAIVNSWNAVVTSSGTAVTAVNQAYNNVIAGGGNTTFGFQASFSGTNAVPTLACSAT